MSDALSRRSAVTILGAAGAAATIGARPLPATPAMSAPADGEIGAQTSTTDVYVPPRGRAFDKFSFDFPEPSVAFGGYQFGFMIFTDENAYGLDRAQMTATLSDDVLTLTCRGLVWAGGQEPAAGGLSAIFKRNGNEITWTAVATAEHPIKSVTTVIRGIPRGGVGFGGGSNGRISDDEELVGYPFSGGDLFGGNSAGGMGTPIAIVRENDHSFIAIASRDARVRTKRFFFQPGENGFRVEAIAEADGWDPQPTFAVPEWSLMHTDAVETAVDAHYAFLERAFHLTRWEARVDVPQWMRDVALVTTLHGQHYSGYIFNDYARMLETLEWMATQIPPARVLVFLSAWDGRYYWDYPNYRANDRMGGDAGFKRLMEGAHRLGFKMMPMFGTNAANRRQPAFKSLADAATAKIDGDVMDLNWVDWDNDRHQEGWLAYMNPGVESWRKWLVGRIDEMITTYGVDAYFLDIVGGWTNNTKADMHDGVRRLVMELRAKHPGVPAVGEMPYDALLEFIPLFQVGLGRMGQYSRAFQHLSSPAPGRGSSGVHESGFSHFNATTLSLSPNAIPTLQVVDDTFTKYRDVMAAVIAKARERAGIA